MTVCKTIWVLVIKTIFFLQFFCCRPFIDDFELKTTYFVVKIILGLIHVFNAFSVFEKQTKFFELVTGFVLPTVIQIFSKNFRSKTESNGKKLLKSSTTHSHKQIRKAARKSENQNMESTSIEEEESRNDKTWMWIVILEEEQSIKTFCDCRHLLISGYKCFL